MQKPSLPEGTRDFGPEQVRRRTFIFDTIRAVFVKFGFQPLETPAMENLSTLTGKYGEEGDKLLFKILNNGDFLKDADDALLASKDAGKLTSVIAKRGLRYDLTVPFARYVVMNRGQLTFPFKRYQIQPVWRADRPQKGRYREFFQCDADVIGSDSLLFEAELALIYDEAFAKLGVPVKIKINNRKILFGIAEAAGIPDQFMTMTVAIDKLDKVGIEGVRKELSERGIPDASIAKIEQILENGTLENLRTAFVDSPSGQAGLAELERVFDLLSKTLVRNEVVFDITLARGLSYYTGCIFEVSAIGYQIGSIGGGGRYADLTGVFGVNGLSGVGISFGADRIYDVMNELKLFPADTEQATTVLLVNFGGNEELVSLKYLEKLHKAGISAEIYPEAAKMKKQFGYADNKKIPFTIIIGTDEATSGLYQLKNMLTGDQEKMSGDEIIEKLMQ